MIAPKYPVNRFTIQYDTHNKTFYLFDSSDSRVAVAHSAHGRELGRLAWDMGAEEVVYNYDLGIDENVPLRLRHQCETKSAR